MCLDKDYLYQISKNVIENSENCNFFYNGKLNLNFFSYAISHKIFKEILQDWKSKITQESDDYKVIYYRFVDYFIFDHRLISLDLNDNELMENLFYFMNKLKLFHIYSLFEQISILSYPKLWNIIVKNTEIKYLVLVENMISNKIKQDITNLQELKKLTAGRKIVNYIEIAMDDEFKFSPLRAKINLRKYLDMVE